MTPQWIDRIYSHFLGRDLAYVFAGGLMFWVVNYTFKLNLDLLGGGFSFKSLAYILGCYFAGLAVSEFSVTVKVVKKDFPMPKKYEGNPTGLLQDIIDRYDPVILNRLERAIYLETIGASVGVAAVWGALAMIIVAFVRISQGNHEGMAYTATMATMTIFGAYMVYHNRMLNNRLKKSYEGFAADIPTRAKRQSPK